MKIVIAGGYDTKNLGDHGSLEVFQRDLRIKDPSIDIVMLSRHLDVEFDTLYNVRSIKNLDHDTKENSVGRWFNGLNDGDDTSHLSEIITELRNTNLLVIGNGRLFVDISLEFLKGPLPYFALLVTLAKFMNIPIMIFSMTIVPLKDEIGRSILKYILSNSDIITVREQPSKEEVLKYGIRDEKVKIVADAAFGLDLVDRKNRGLELFEKEGIHLGRKKFIGINLRYTHLDHSIGKDYYSSLAQLCDKLYTALDTDILLIPQMTYKVDNPLDDDREVYKVVFEKVTNKRNIHVLMGEYNIFDTMALYQCCEMVYSMRRHGLIFSATQNIPIFGLSGERNTTYVLNTLGIGDCIQDISEISSSSNYDSLIFGFQQKESIREKMQAKVLSYKMETLEYAELAFSLINNSK
jgi:colanic acid/amylovoran biosynthesis protein